jgi:hypothetical protein
MFLTQEQAERRLNSERNLTRAKFLKSEENAAIEIKVVEKIISLPGKNRANLSEEQRTEIAIRTRTGEKISEVARDVGVKSLTVQNIANGKTKGVDEEKVESVIREVKDLALQRLMTSLGLLSDDKLSGCSARDLSVIASNMGRVVEKIQNKVEQPDNINFIIYAPELKQERAFDSVEI